MQLTLYQIDAFTTRLFHGNPAAVVPLAEWLDDQLLQNIAAENNLSETAFFVGRQGNYNLRWFTPLAEIDLCGHATLASAWVIQNHLHDTAKELSFNTRSGTLIVSQVEQGLLMDFPAQLPLECIPPSGLVEAIAVKPKEVLQADDYIVVLNNEHQVQSLKPDLSLFKQLPLRAVVVTAVGDEVDFVSRMFAPKLGIDEDSVTGSSHCSLVPYWAGKLGKVRLTARQISKRGGEILCELKGDRVSLIGDCVEYMQATINV